MILLDKAENLNKILGNNEKFSFFVKKNSEVVLLIFFIQFSLFFNCMFNSLQFSPKPLLYPYK